MNGGEPGITRAAEAVVPVRLHGGRARAMRGEILAVAAGLPSVSCVVTVPGKADLAVATRSLPVLLDALSRAPALAGADISWQPDAGIVLRFADDAGPLAPFTPATSPNAGHNDVPSRTDRAAAAPGRPALTPPNSTGLPSRPHRRSWRRRHRLLVRAGIVAAVLALILAAAAVLTLREVIALQADLRTARSEMSLTMDQIDPLRGSSTSLRETEATLTVVDLHLRIADAALASAHTHARRLRPLFAAAALLPGWPRGLRQASPLIATARGAIRAGIEADAAFLHVTSSLDTAGRDDPPGARLVGALTEALPQLEQALTDLDGATAARRAVDGGRLDGPLRPGRDALATFDRHAPSLHDSLTALVALPAAAGNALGMNGPRTYLVLGQNSAELRPTGGFIGSVGLLTINGATVTSERYMDSYHVDNPERGFEPLPEPMAEHLGGANLALRDANWSPDFPTSARHIETIFARHQDVQVDGVIGFTTPLVGMLLDALGPLPVEGFDQPLTAATWYDLAERLIYVPGPDGSGRVAAGTKGAVLGPILNAVVGRIQHLPVEQWPGLLRVFQQAVRQRQLLLYFNDGQAASLARRADADGRFAPSSGDTLAVVDANLSYSKVGPYIDKGITYEVWLDARGVAATSRVTVSYANRLTPEQALDPDRRIGGAEYEPADGTLHVAPGVYGTYTRVYVPRNSRVLSVQSDGPLPWAGEDLGFSTIEQYERVPPSGRVSFSYTYQIPTDLMPPGAYRLHIIKQPGTTTTQIEVRIHLPDGIDASASLPVERGENQIVYRGALTADLDLSVSLAGA